MTHISASTVGTRVPSAAADGYRATGTSPTSRIVVSTEPVRPQVATGNEAASRASGKPRPRSYDTVHVIGPGAVGRALLERFAGDRRRIIAVTDSTATVHDPRGLDPRAVIEWKKGGRALRDHAHAQSIPSAQAVGHVDADVVADASATDLDRAEWTAALGAALARGACVASAAKAALCEAGAEWFTGEHRSRVGCNAVLGGTGRSFIGELPELQQRTRGIAIVGNASTTAILDVVERGGTLAEGITEAQRLGFLEPDPELDLRGTDAAVKLAIVAGIVTGRRIDPRTIACTDIRAIDLLAVRARARRGAATRLIGRLSGTGALGVSYEEVPRDSVLAAPCGRVVYEYRLDRDERRLHLGSGLGAAATAGALWSDIRALAAEAASRSRQTAGGAR
jgi:homoserine dehydrogenase